MYHNIHTTPILINNKYMYHNIHTTPVLINNKYMYHNIHTTPTLISLFTATCFGSSYEPSWGLI
jgi:hypothetical protein